MSTLPKENIIKIMNVSVNFQDVQHQPCSLQLWQNFLSEVMIFSSVQTTERNIKQHEDKHQTQYAKRNTEKKTEK